MAARNEAGHGEDASPMFERCHLRYDDPFDPLQSSQLGAESGRVGQAGEITEEAKLAGVEGVLQALQE